MYISGSFDKFGGVNTWNVVKYDGENFTGFPPPTIAEDWHNVGNMLMYKGQLHIAGYFSRINIARWNGSAWERLGGSVPQANAGVGDIIEYEGKLIAGGNFCRDNNNTYGNCVAAWDGEQWSYMDSGIVCGGSFVDFEVFQGELYGVGPIRLLEGGTYAAKWNGHRWVKFADFDGDMAAITQLNGELYFSGTFEHVNGIEAYHIVKYSPLAPPLDSLDFGIYPNPTDGELILQKIQLQDLDLQLYNHLGQRIAPLQALQHDREVHLSLPSGLASGIYYLRLGGKAGDKSYKIMLR
jgi:Secretion system C-terminal sorting domain